jgi:L-malate glycosyltransferase
MATATSIRFRVMIVKPFIKQYRVVFFEKLCSALVADGVELTVLYGEPPRREQLKADNVDLPPNVGQKIPSVYLFGRRALLQIPGAMSLFRSDMVVLVHANGNLLNIPLLLASRLGLKKIALWGHDRNYQGQDNVLRERFKKLMSRIPDWWFSYTEKTASNLVNNGYHSDRITVINNAIDTSCFRAELDSISNSEVELMRERLGLSDRDRVALYCGSLYPEKRLSLMIDAAARLVERYPLFKLVVIGGGVDADQIVHACQNHQFIRYAGPLFGQEKAVCYHICEFVFNPGLVGLAILDAFAAGKPLVTMADSLHSPEISYLYNGRNGLLVEGGVSELVGAVSALMEDEVWCKEMAVAAEETAQEYSLENMVERVRSGILRCLAA